MRHVPAAVHEVGMSVSSIIMSCVAHLFGYYLYLTCVRPVAVAKRMMLHARRYDPDPDRAAENSYMHDGFELMVRPPQS